MSCKTIFLCAIGILVIIGEIITLAVASGLSTSAIELSFMQIKWYDYANSFLWIVIGILICRYAIIEDDKVLKVLLGLMVVGLMYQIISLATFPNDEQISAEVDSQAKKLQTLMPDYDWLGKGESTRIKATESWNSIQDTFKCCGLESRKDWDSYRPVDLAPNVYPSTCCIFKTTKYCTIDGLAGLPGCSQQIKNFCSAATTFAPYAITFLVLVIACIGFYLYKKSESS